jgi:hypothetical protein
MKEMNQNTHHGMSQLFWSKIPCPAETKQERSLSSFQLAKFLSQLIASRRRKTPVHLDGEKRRRRESLEEKGGIREILYLMSGARAQGVIAARLPNATKNKGVKLAIWLE